MCALYTLGMKPNYARVLGASVAALYFLHAASTPKDWHFFDGIDLIFHEAGHTIFSFFGEFIDVLMGSGFQVLLPLLISVYFFYTRQNFAGSLTLMWVGQSFINVSVYAGDAQVMQLPLLGVDAAMHDWNYLLSTLQALPYTSVVATALYDFGLLFILGGIALACLSLTTSDTSYSTQK